MGASPNNIAGWSRKFWAGDIISGLKQYMGASPNIIAGWSRKFRAGAELSGLEH